MLQDEQRPLETALKAHQDGLGYSVAIKGAQRRIPCVGEGVRGERWKKTSLKNENEIQREKSEEEREPERERERERIWDKKQENEAHIDIHVKREVKRNRK